MNDRSVGAKTYAAWSRCLSRLVFFGLARPIDMVLSDRGEGVLCSIVSAVWKSRCCMLRSALSCKGKEQNDRYLYT